MREQLLSWFDSFYYLIISIKEIIVDIGNFVVSIFKTLRYGLSTITSGIWSVFNEVIDNGAITTLQDTLNNISSLLGGPAMVVLFSMFLIIITRIFIAFIFKLFRLNIDYHSLQDKSTRWNVEDLKKRY